MSTSIHSLFVTYPLAALFFGGFLVLLPQGIFSEKFFDANSYIKYNSVTDPNENQLRGAEDRLEFQFRYCNDYGILIYQSGDSSNTDQSYFFAVGVNSGRIYLEWRVSDTLIELYIGDGNMQANMTYTVRLYNLRIPFEGSTFAFINDNEATVDFLTPISSGGLDTTKLLGPLYIGGYEDVNDLIVNTERLTAYLIVCLDYINTILNTLDLDQADVAWGVTDECPHDFCAPPSTITLQSSSAFISMDINLEPETRTIISLNFKTMAQKGMLFYLGGPAYLTTYMVDGVLVLGLNTKGSGSGVFASTSTAGYNDGEWHYIQVIREGSVARIEDEFNNQLVAVEYTSLTGVAQTLNAEALYIGGVKELSSLPTYFPLDAETSFRGCIKELRFVAYSLTPEPPQLLDFDIHILEEREVSHGGCLTSLLCEPSCDAPSQLCDFTCHCAPGFQQFFATPLICLNIDDCQNDPCLNGATCIDEILDYTCQCTLEYNKGKNCSIANNCIPDMCENGATCNDYLEGFNCTCAPGYEGELCSQEIDECSSDPCMNNAACLDQVNGYICTCLPGYAGSDCQTNIDECQSSPCLNSATCHDAINAYSCTCAAGWLGQHCEVELDECLSGPCENEANCIDQVNMFECECRPGWEGIYCQQEINECLLGYCQNFLNCTDLFNDYLCLCELGWEGKNCDVDIDECISDPCSNNGLCLDRVYNYTCQCFPGYEGAHCEHNINECFSSPCLNNGTCEDQVNQYACICPPAWSGANCQQEVDECQSNPCLNQATCRDSVGSYACDCSPGFIGVHCEIEVDECGSSPCVNGLCEDKVNSYFCQCSAGYEGNQCQNEIDECLSSPCIFGTCLDKINSYTCVCSVGYSGIECELNIDDCESGPCLNQATCLDRVNGVDCVCALGFTSEFCSVDIDECLEDEGNQKCQNGATCIDAINSFICSCPPGWEGNFCEEEINECDSAPCKNNGTCLDQVNGYSCFCPSNFGGALCDVDVDECSGTLDPCVANHTMYCNNTYGGYQCICNPGFFGLRCEEDEDECLSDPCYFDGVCFDLIGGYVCSCADGYIGPNCEAVIRECQFNPCGHNSICIENPSGGFTCYCEPGYYGGQCQYEIMECGSDPCKNGATCVELINKYECTCFPGFEGINCEIDTPECESKPCLNGGICSEPEPFTFKCECLPGYTGNICDINMDNCDPNPCETYEMCKDLVNGYMCECPDGMTGSLCNVIIDDCHSLPCQNGATCIDGESRYDCQCPSGWDGVNCHIDIDVCDPNPCFHGGSCDATPSTVYKGYNFTCYCAEGFTGAQCEGDIYECRSQPCQNGGTCLEKVDGTLGFVCQCSDDYIGDFCDVFMFGCLSNPCRNGATCSNTDQGYICECLVGWESTQCELDTNECEANTAVCLNGAQCVNKEGSYECLCTDYWQGEHCELDFLECNSQPCLNGGNCTELLGQSYLCECPTSHSGYNCEVEIDECSSMPCSNEATCENLIGSFQCHCLPGYEGKQCETDTNECDSSPCNNNATCNDFVNGFDCSCNVGFSGTNCETNINDCLDEPCLSLATCIDLINSYECLCTEGWKGANCEENIDECSSNPCLNNATCLDLLNGYACSCHPGYIGVHCETDIDECSSSPCVHGTCLDFVNFYTCVCDNGYIGSNCSQDVQECGSGPCLNGGNCTEPALGLFECICPDGVAGSLCESVNVASFTGSQFLLYPSIGDLLAFFSSRRKRAVDQLVVITIEFITTISNGVILYTQGVQDDAVTVDYFAMELADGFVRVSYSTGKETAEAIIVGLPVNDGREHLVTVSVLNQRVDVSLDAGTCALTTCSQSVSTPSPGYVSFNGPLYLGGVGPAPTAYAISKLESTEGFTGCLQNFLINGNSLSLDPNTYSGTSDESRKRREVDQTDPAPGCQAVDNCQPNPCQSNALCIDHWTFYSCKCGLGFTGNNCEFQFLASFTENSFLHFPGSDQVTTLNFWFSAQNTTESNGLLLYTVSGLAVSLSGGSLQIVLLELGSIQKNELGYNMTNGEWYKVMLFFNNKFLYITVTNEVEVTLFSETLISNANIELQFPLFFGQLHPDSSTTALNNVLAISTSFVGCVRNVEVNSVLLDLDTYTTYQADADPTVAKPGCPRQENCLPTDDSELSICLNGGTCHSSWMGFTCDCTLAYTGETCDEALAATYSGSAGHTQLTVDATSFSFGDYFSLNFRTRDDEGVIMYIKIYSVVSATLPQAYMTLKLVQSKLRFETDFGSGAQMIDIPVMVNNGVYYPVSWKRSTNNINLEFLGLEYSIEGSFPIFTPDFSNKIEIFIGGDPTTDEEFFKGCIQDVKFNQQTTTYVDSTSLAPGLTANNYDVVLGCVGDDVCSAQSVCPPNSDCVDLWNAVECQCQAGWEGDNCDQSFDDCIVNSCQNGAMCIDAHLSYTCSCLDGFEGEYCDELINLCLDNPCSVENTITCVPEFPSDYNCQCKPGYEGKNCTKDSTPCSFLPCQNNATCQNSAENTAYTCTCLDYYEGPNCEFYNPCFNHQCANNASCLANDDHNTYDCECISGFWGDLCTFIDSCLSDPCHEGVCERHELGYTCICSSFYEGPDCQTPVDLCLDENPCLNNGVCFHNTSQPESNLTCHCPIGFFGSLCEFEIDECDSDPCHLGICEDSVASYTCQCFAGYSGTNCQENINECEGVVCENNGYCVDRVDEYECICPDHFSGTFCEQDLRDCSLNLCTSGSICIDEITGFSCLCPTGYGGEYCELQINDCALNPCLNLGTCIFIGVCACEIYPDSISDCGEDALCQLNACLEETACRTKGQDELSFECDCTGTGYSGILCGSLVDECLSSPCLNGGTCVDGVDNYSCQCPVYYEGVNCELDRRSCSLNLCENNSTCIDQDYGFSCSCAYGYGGSLCEKIINVCGDNPCMNGAACEFIGSCVCEIYPDSILACGLDGFCQEEACRTEPACRHLLTTEQNFTCDCNDYYEGLLCDIDIDECSLDSCAHDSVCTNTPGSFSCNCAGTGYEGDTCLQDIDECLTTLEPCQNNGICLNSPGFYQCSCLLGYSGDFCEKEVNECESSPCVHGICADLINGFSCNCTGGGYEGITCEVDVDECQTLTQQCLNNAECVNSPSGSYSCLCVEQYEGLFCENYIASTSQVQTQSETVYIIVAVVIILLLLCILIYGYWYLKKSQKMKGKYRPSKAENEVGIPLSILDVDTDERLI